MKLNAATEMYPITWPGNISFICELECSHKVTEFAALHPFVPRDQVFQRTIEHELMNVVRLKDTLRCSIDLREICLT